MKKLDVKTIITLLFAVAVVLMTLALVGTAIVLKDLDSIKALIERFSTATISALSLALGYFFGRVRSYDEPPKQ